MLQRFAVRSAAVSRARGAAHGNTVTKIQVAHFVGGDMDDGDDEDPEDPIISKDRRDTMPRRQTMPDAAKKNRFMVVAPENRGKVRRRILEEFKKEEISLDDVNTKGMYQTPDTGILRDIREMNKEEEDMQFDEEEDIEPLNLGRLGLLRQIVHVDKVQKVWRQCTWYHHPRVIFSNALLFALGLWTK